MKNPLYWLAAPAAATLVSLGVGLDAPKAPEPDPIEIFVGPGKEVRVTVSHVSKKQLSEIVAAMLLEEKKAKTNFEAVIGTASNVTLILTTKRSKPGK